ncbi:MAG: AAA family ATPase [Burkholderiaceae bacterium]|nr:AAA family ATPase [Burkholderiaceae bacterium]
MRDSHFPVTIKTSAPSLDGVIERARLVDALAKLPAAAKWLQAPSGTGKSTLAASYARRSSKPLVWYRLDERDNDPAFFYAEFAQAIRTQLRLTRQLPKFSSDDHERQHEFAQRFAAGLSGQLAKPVLIVLDDVHRVTNEEMQRALAAIVAAAANGVELLFVSQPIAPTSFFDLIGSRQLALLNDADLRFEVDECTVMIAALRISAAHSESIAALTGGHAGALVLACELLRDTDPKSALGVQTVERIHSHLLTKLVERMPQPQRELLLQTAFVTQLTRSIAVALAGTEAALQLDALVESGILRRVGAGETEVFEAHGLVRQGMQALTHSRLGQAAARALAEHTASTLIECGQTEAAFALLVENQSTARAISVLQQLAEHYAARGQIDLLMDSIAKLPAPDVHCNAWLCFWTGQALLRIDEERARVWFAQAHSAFGTASDVFGMRLAAASMVIAFGLEHADLRELEIWIQRHRDVGGETPIASTERFEPTLLMAIVCAALMQGEYPAQSKSLESIPRLMQLLEMESVWLSHDQRVQAGRLLIEHARVFHGDQIQASNAIVATRRLIQDGIGGALHRGRWLIAAAYAHFEVGNTAASLEYLQQARALAEQSSSLRLQFELSLALADHWMKAQMLPQAAAELDRLEHLAGACPPAQRAEFARIMARLLLLQERHTDGLRWAEDAMRLAVPAGFNGANLRKFEVELVYALAANERLADALTLIKQHDAVPIEAGFAIAHCLQFLMTGGIDQHLRSGLKNARQINFLNLLDRARQPLTRICEAALDNNIESEFVQQLIAIKKLKPSPAAGPTWPWPVRVKTLGEFRLDIGGRFYRPSHKAQDKPLELLRLLITSQALGREFAEKSWIVERLWPDADADSARKSLDMAISRLRKLLECEDAILVSEGRVRLSPIRVWTDIKPLRDALADVRKARDDHASSRARTIDQAASSVKAVLTHYKGVFCAGEEESPWLLAGREAIASSVRHVLLTADSILAGSPDSDLIPALRQALLHDPASEDLARALMRAHLRCGQKSEALSVYRRLRDMLSLLMGLAPSSETEQIRDRALSRESQ